MIGFNFTKYIPTPNGEDKFQQMLNLFMQLLQYTNGDVNEAMDWMNQIDREYKLTDNKYGMGNFVQDLKDKGYIKENPINGNFDVTSKTNQSIRQKSLEEVFD